MPEEKTPGEEVASGLHSIFERVGEFFHIFDLSFFVSGSMTFGALAFVYILMGKSHQFPFMPWVGIFALIIACYVCGLISFAVGRELSGLTFRRSKLKHTLPLALEAHNLKDENIASYINGENPQYWWLYIRMWSEIVHETTSPVVIHHLMRYWAMAATYDGVAFSFIVWACALIILQFRNIAPDPVGQGAGTVGAFLCLCAAFFAFRRGANYYEYQIEDVVAHFAVMRCSLTSQAGLTPMPDIP
jgi:hypothetical protein